MAILKSTTPLENDAHNKELAEQYYQNNLMTSARLIVDLETLYHESLKNGINLIDYNIIHRIKGSLAEVFTELGMFNAYVFADTDGEVLKAKESQENSDPTFLKFQNYPRTKVGYHPRNKERFDESDEDVLRSNESVARTVRLINNIVMDIPVSTTNEVRHKYTVSHDGYQIQIKFHDIYSINAVLERISLFIATVENISLDELMIAQQFSEWFSVIQTNPFELEKQPLDNYKKSIVISVFNLNDHSSCFYLSAILKIVKQNIIDHIKHGDQLALSFKNESINNSFLCVDLVFN